ncbi:hypothetical protein BDR22DRAFT_549967 [Usnea florida]
MILRHLTDHQPEQCGTAMHIDPELLSFDEPMTEEQTQRNASKPTTNLTIETNPEDLLKPKKTPHPTMPIRSHPTASTPTALYPTACTPTTTTSVAPRRNIHLIWHGTPFTLNECRLACALAIHVCFEDRTPLDHITIGRVIGAAKGLEEMNCEGLVDHLRNANDVYAEVASGGNQWGDWAQNAWNLWLDPKAAPLGSWP